MKNDQATKRLKGAAGQVQAAIKMMEEERYCVDVSHQILAAIALLKKANHELLKQHMNSCVAQAFNEGNGSEKMEEVLLLVSKLTG